MTILLKKCLEMTIFSEKVPNSPFLCRTSGIIVPRCFIVGGKECGTRKRYQWIVPQNPILCPASGIIALQTPILCRTSNIIVPSTQASGIAGIESCVELSRATLDSCCKKTKIWSARMQSLAFRSWGFFKVCFFFTCDCHSQNKCLILKFIKKQRKIFKFEFLILVQFFFFFLVN